MAEKCVDGTCHVSDCAQCATNPATCERCMEGFWLDDAANACLDATCQIDGCKQCSSKGPTVCDACELGYLLL